MRNKTLVSSTYLYLFIFLTSVGSILLLSGCAGPSSGVRGNAGSRGDTAAHSPNGQADGARPQAAVNPAVQTLPETGDSPSAAQVSSPTPLPPTPQPVESTATPAEAPVQTSPTPEQDPDLGIPTRLLIPAIGLDAPIVAVGWSIIEQNGQQVSEWDVPTWRAAGWLKTSAPVAEPGNTVLEGHQDIDGRVFENLEYLKQGDEIQVQTSSQTRKYVVALRTIVPEKDQPLEVRRENARWIAHTSDERLTLVTCWPRDNNTHRLILVALPTN